MLARIFQNDPLLRLRDEMDDMLEHFVQDLPAAREFAENYPAINLWEDDAAAYAEAELPGMNAQEIEILVRGNEVTIKGERKVVKPETQATYYRRERASGAFERALTLPWPIDADHIEAKMADGVLTVKLPKAESAKPKKIQVTA